MDKKRSVHFNYTFETLPVIFHSQTEDFFKYLNRDGLKFLEYWWDHMSIRLDDDKNEGFDGTKYEIRDVPEKKSQIVLITLPTPKHYNEVYLMAFVRTPLKRWFVRISNTRVFVLEYVPTERSSTGTFFGEITPRARFLRYEEGMSVPDLEAFYQKVYETVWKK